MPDHITTCLFDLDGVLTQTAKVHNAAWTEMFDAYLRERSARTGEPFVPFDPAGDYNSYVDGRPRADGVRTFLASRGIELPEGTPDDPPTVETVNGLGNRKNEKLLERLRKGGVDVYPDVLRKVMEIRSLRGHPFEFYRKLGYVVTGIIPDANGFGKPDIFMAKRLTEARGG